VSTVLRRRRTHVLVMAKAPEAGRVKTRLCPPCTPVEAAAIAEAALGDTLDAVVACQADRKVVALAGPAGPWLPPGVEVISQRGDQFDERLVHAWEDLRCSSGGWGLQIGMDTPQVTAALLDEQLDALTSRSRAGRVRLRPPAILGPATDGGWWLIGLPGSEPRAVFAGVPMSTSHTGRAQAQRLRSLGLDVVLAPELRDIDDTEDLRLVTTEIPDSRTGMAGAPVLARVGPASFAEVGC
jgi:glycosyltransferase A (GT-A) superfamily protein (DUF2064 family)